MDLIQLQLINHWVCPDAVNCDTELDTTQNIIAPTAKMIKPWGEEVPKVNDK